jgi:diguanylate cyclase (GGDEF)-like protein
MERDNTTTQRLNIVERLKAHTAAARLIVIQGDVLGRNIELAERAVMIGRGASCDFLIQHASVSRQHCKIWNEGGRFYIADLGSTNQTMLNGARVEHGELQDEDRITVGEIELKFLAPHNIESGYHQALYQMANIDSLTQLPNRRIFRDALDQAIEVANQTKQALSLIFVDLDHFKKVNDEIGHLAGDEVLKLVAAVLRDSLCDGCIAGRIGGEEFAIMLPNADLQKAALYAEKLRAGIQAIQDGLPEGVRGITSSAGIAYWNSNKMKSSADLMRAADAQLMRAKTEGRNRVCYVPDID